MWCGLVVRHLTLKSKNSKGYKNIIRFQYKTTPIHCTGVGSPANFIGVPVFLFEISFVSYAFIVTSTIFFKG